MADESGEGTLDEMASAFEVDRRTVSLVCSTAIVKATMVRAAYGTKTCTLPLNASP